MLWSIGKDSTVLLWLIRKAFLDKIPFPVVHLDTTYKFKEIYDLPLSTRGIMNIAYFGEITTPSRCGRLDQACAYNSPVLMTFDADKLKVDKLKVKENISLIIGDLNGKKNTQKILSALNQGFPFPTTESERKKHEYLGEINKDIVFRAIEHLQKGDVEKIGELMREAQEEFDFHLAPACPSELTSPRLHEILGSERIKPYTFGGKGVGSQGDGCVQLVCRSKEDREKAKEILGKEMNVDCLDIDLKNNL